MLYFFKLFFVALLSLPASLIIILVFPFDPRGELAYKPSRLWCSAVLKIVGIRLTVRGLEQITPGRPYVFVANHQSHLDIPLLAHALVGFQLRWLAKKELARIPIFGWALRAARNIIVDRSDPAKAAASLKKAREALAMGVSLVFFPEGTRSRSGELLPFRRGGFLLAAETGTTIVPITIKGSHLVLPRGDWRMRAGEVEVVLGRPIAVEKSGLEGVRALAERARAAIEAELRSLATASAETAAQAWRAEFDDAP
jgi:1-acyl-sn-glycerol-3-phosphate acyltransferase